MEGRSDAGLTTPQIEVLGATLYHLAAIDGIASREEELLKEFLNDVGSTMSYEQLTALPYSPAEVAQVFPTSFHRRMVLKAALTMIRADGEFSSEERRALGELADAIGVSNADYGELEREAESTNF